MDWKVKEIEVREFDKDFAIEGDMYWYHNGKLIFAASALIDDCEKKSLIKRIKAYLWRKRHGNIVVLNKRTLEYIFNVCKGVMPSSKEDFVKCVMGSLPE